MTGRLQRSPVCVTAHWQQHENHTGLTYVWSTELIRLCQTNVSEWENGNWCDSPADLDSWFLNHRACNSWVSSVISSTVCVQQCFNWNKKEQDRNTLLFVIENVAPRNLCFSILDYGLKGSQFCWGLPLWDLETTDLVDQKAGSRESCGFTIKF